MKTISSPSDKPLRLFPGIHKNATTDQEQAFIRFFLGLAIFTYLFLANTFTTSLVSLPGHIVWLAFGFMVYTGSMLAIVLYNRQASTIRRSICMLIDFSFIAYGMNLLNDMGPVLYTILLWSVFGYGVRYGKKFLFSASILAVSVYLIVISTTPFWINNPTLSLGLLVGMLVFSVFIYALLGSIEKEMGKAEEANRAKDRFIANMSHEMRTPLNGIIAMGDMLSISQLDEDQREFSNTIQVSSQALLDIVDDVLDISKIESGQIPVNKIQFDLNQLVISTVNMFKQQAIEKGLSLEYHIDTTTPHKLVGDAHHLRHILINLVGNAVKFTNKGNVKILIGPESIDKYTTRIKFDIVDTGIGIPHKQQQSIFNLFTQADDSVTRRYSGVGLGTTISRDLVRLMGGNISLESTPGEGTCFSFVLPFLYHLQDDNPDAILDDMQADEVNAGNEDETIISEHGILSEQDTSVDTVKVNKILVVSKNEDTYERLGYYLSTWDMDVYYANNASEAFAQLIDASHEAASFNKVFIDEPGIDIDAIQLCHAIEGEESIIKPELFLIHSPGKKYDPSTLESNIYKAILTSPVNEVQLHDALQGKVQAVTSQDYKTPEEQESSLNILVAEDNRVSQRVIERLIDQLGYSSHIVDNGELALKLIQENTYDLAILDLHMPDMSGIDLINRYHALGQDDAIPLVMLTANITPEAKQACLEAGVKEFLTKPVTSQQLENSISAIFDRDKLFDLDLPGTSPVASSVLDSDALAELVSLDAGNGFLNRLCASFEEDADTLLENIRTEMDNADYTYIKELIHALKGSAGNVGASEFHRRCAYYCNMTENEFHDHQQKVFPDLHEKFTAARHALREYIEEYNALPG